MHDSPVPKLIVALRTTRSARERRSQSERWRAERCVHRACENGPLHVRDSRMNDGRNSLDFTRNPAAPRPAPADHAQGSRLHKHPASTTVCTYMSEHSGNARVIPDPARTPTCIGAAPKRTRRFSGKMMTFCATCLSSATFSQFTLRPKPPTPASRYGMDETPSVLTSPTETNSTTLRRSGHSARSSHIVSRVRPWMVGRSGATSPRCLPACRL